MPAAERRPGPDRPTYRWRGAVQPSRASSIELSTTWSAAPRGPPPAARDAHADDEATGARRPARQPAGGRRRLCAGVARNRRVPAGHHRPRVGQDLRVDDGAGDPPGARRIRRRPLRLSVAERADGGPRRHARRCGRGVLRRPPRDRALRHPLDGGRAGAELPRAAAGAARRPRRDAEPPQPGQRDRGRVRRVPDAAGVPRPCRLRAGDGPGRPRAPVGAGTLPPRHHHRRPEPEPDRVVDHPRPRRRQGRRGPGAARRRLVPRAAGHPHLHHEPPRRGRRDSALPAPRAVPGRDRGPDPSGAGRAGPPGPSRKRTAASQGTPAIRRPRARRGR